jgi:hypothetical protein
LWLRLKALFARKCVEREIEDELAFHIDIQTRKNVSRGLPIEEARRQALVKFGGVAQTAEGCRDQRRINGLATLLQDIRYAVRSFWRSPGFVAVVVATIGVGLGINATVFTVFNAYVLRPYPVRDPYSLYRLDWMTSQRTEGRWLSWDEYQAFPKRPRSRRNLRCNLSDLFLWTGDPPRDSWSRGTIFKCSASLPFMDAF